MQAPAGNTFQRVLGLTAGIGFAIVVVGLVTGLIPPPKHALADSSHIVSIYFDGQKKVITTNASTVSDALKEAGVSLNSSDLVEPGVSTAIPEGFFNINVYRSRPVVLVDGVQRKTVMTALQSPHLIAESAGIKTFPEDTYETSTIKDVAALGVIGQEITIHRATPVIIAADGTQTMVRTQQKTVGAMLVERDVALGPQDTVATPKDAPITPDMVVVINRVKVVVLKQTEAIPHDTKTVKDNTLTAGTTKVITPGADGQKISTYRVHFQNGIEQSRALLDTAITAQPVTQVTAIGTKIDYSANPVELGKQMAAARGWSGSQWNALYQLWQRESGWNPNSSNVWTGACGIPQAYPCSKIRDHSTGGQITWGLDYIAGKYGDPESAWAYWQRNHSY